MVWHQAICPYFDVPVRTSLGHQVYVCLIIFIAEECLQTPIPLLSYMMRYFWNYHTSNPGHGRILTILKTKSIIKYGVPRIHLWSGAGGGGFHPQAQPRIKSKHVITLRLILSRKKCLFELSCFEGLGSGPRPFHHSLVGPATNYHRWHVFRSDQTDSNASDSAACG